jgi:glucose dehydrogenase
MVKEMGFWNNKERVTNRIYLIIGLLNVIVDFTLTFLGNWEYFIAGVCFLYVAIQILRGNSEDLKNLFVMLFGLISILGLYLIL